MNSLNYNGTGNFCGRKKAQVSIETIFSVIVLIMIFAFSIIYSVYARESNNNARETLEVQGICWKISNFITEVFASGDGIYVNTFLNNMHTFEVFPSSKFISVTSDLTGAQAVCTIQTNRVSNVGSSVPASFRLANTTSLHLTNVNGLVVIT